MNWQMYRRNKPALVVSRISFVVCVCVFAIVEVSLKAFLCIRAMASVCLSLIFLNGFHHIVFSLTFSGLLRRGFSVISSTVLPIHWYFLEFPLFHCATLHSESLSSFAFRFYRQQKKKTVTNSRQRNEICVHEHKQQQHQREHQ